MTVAVLETRTTGTVIHRPATHPTLSIVLVSPAGELSSCQKVIRQLTSSGAVVFIREIQAEGGAVGTDSAAISDIVWTIGGTVDQATGEFPELPVILVGHGSTASAALAFTELFPDDCLGLVLTQPPSA
jgi:hypothetical protein